MAWNHLSITKAHLAYMILGGFTSLFMLCSLFIKEKLYIGEASVATICGVIFGPHAADLFNPLSWGNTDSITLECSRIVLVVQCFAVGVELPKSYMERHWKSVTFLLVPVMTYGWLMTSLFIWWMVEPLTWLESLAVAACVTATDPVLASSVVGKGKFAKRVPKHLRDILSAESGCNDGMAFPFIYLSVYLIEYRPHAGEVAFHWICYTILYECIFGAVYGFLIGYFARHAIKWAEKKGLIDRESFLVFYFVLALFCAGSGSFLGMDDLLIGFSAGVGFSNDGWFSEKTEESHVSNVIDLLLNLAYFVYLGSIIPWGQYNSPEHGLVPWRLVVISVFVIFFRRIPIMLALKPIIPDIKTWREALFAGHFGPIGVGAIFAAILARSELEHGNTEPLAVLPPPGSKNYNVVYLIWPITTFMVVTSIIVHGSSIAVFTLGKRINTLTITMSYTQANDEGPLWMNRLPRISSQSKQDLSFRKEDEYYTDESQEKFPEYPPGTLPPLGLPGNFLRRQKEDENPSRQGSRSSSRNGRRKKWDSGMGPGGPISQSAIAPQRRADVTSPPESGSDTLNEKQESSPEARQASDDFGPRSHAHRPSETAAQIEVYEEGHEMIVEDAEGNVLKTEDVRGLSQAEKERHIYDVEKALANETSGEHAKNKDHPHERNEGEELQQTVSEAMEDPAQGYKNLKSKLGNWGWGGKKGESSEKPKPERRRGPAHAYQFGNTIIVEDEDGEVIKKFTIPTPEKKVSDGGQKMSVVDSGQTRQRLARMGTWVGIGGSKEDEEVAPEGDIEAQGKPIKRPEDEESDDEHLRFNVTLPGGGRSRRMSKTDFINQIRNFDPKARAEIPEESEVPDHVKGEASRWANEGQTDYFGPAADSQQQSRRTRMSRSQSHAATSPSQQRERPTPSRLQTGPAGTPGKEHPERHHHTHLDPPQEEQSRRNSVDSRHSAASNVSATIPSHDVSVSLARFSVPGSETAAGARRRRLAQENYDEDGNPRIASPATQGETAAEKRRRLAALGSSGDRADSESEDDGRPRVKKGAVPGPPEHVQPARERGGTQHDPSTSRRPEQRVGIRFEEAPSPSSASRPSGVRWGGETGRVKRKGFLLSKGAKE
jgi:NhaP-type Na+/H+ or K+/H+ antiporter